MGGQLTGECAGREDHRAFQTVSDTGPGPRLLLGHRCPLRPVAGPSPVRGTGEGTRARPTDRCGGRAAAWPLLCPCRGVGPRRSGARLPPSPFPIQGGGCRSASAKPAPEGVPQAGQPTVGLRPAAPLPAGSVRLSRPTRPNRAAPEPGPEPLLHPDNPRPGQLLSPAATPASHFLRTRGYV